VDIILLSLILLQTPSPSCSHSQMMHYCTLQ